MRIISLDQNAVSNLVKNGHEPFWRDLRAMLVAGVEAGKLLCPIPKETIAETVFCSRDIRIKIRDLQERLSLGFSFKPFESIEAEETLALVRQDIAVFPFELIVWHSVEDDSLLQTLGKKMREAQKDMCQRMCAFVPSPDRAKLSVKELRRKVITSRAGAFYRQLERLIRGQPVDTTDDMQIDLCQFLVARGITCQELTQLREKVITHEWEQIPLLCFHAALGALLDHSRLRGKRYQVNDEIDLFRAAVALDSSAMMITERSLAHFVRLLEKETGGKLDVFAVNEHERIRTAVQEALVA